MQCFARKVVVLQEPFEVCKLHFHVQYYVCCTVCSFAGIQYRWLGTTGALLIVGDRPPCHVAFTGDTSCVQAAYLLSGDVSPHIMTLAAADH